jgi:hypothetical protein
VTVQEEEEKEKVEEKGDGKSCGYGALTRLLTYARSTIAFCSSSLFCLVSTALNPLQSHRATMDYI